MQSTQICNLFRLCKWGGAGVETAQEVSGLVGLLTSWPGWQTWHRAVQDDLRCFHPLTRALLVMLAESIEGACWGQAGCWATAMSYRQAASHKKKRRKKR
eukprot:10859906-Prorocentrum_lima.AAC.1